MKAVPMIFNTEMVQALLDGRKSVTRRPVKLSLHSVKQGVTLKDIVKVCRSKEEHLFSAVLNDNFDHVGTFSVPCRVGDLIYVRETWGVVTNAFDDDGNMIAWKPDRPSLPVKEMKFGNGYYTGNAIYRSDGEMRWCNDFEEEISAWKPSIHMPRSISRLTLKVTDVRIETLNDLRKNKEQIKKEGFESWPQFKHVWESIYGQSHPNDYVWVIEFEVIHKNVDQVLREMEVAA